MVPNAMQYMETLRYAQYLQNRSCKKFIKLSFHAFIPRIQHIEDLEETREICGRKKMRGCRSSRWVTKNSKSTCTLGNVWIRSQNFGAQVFQNRKSLSNEPIGDIKQSFQRIPCAVAILKEKWRLFKLQITSPFFRETLGRDLRRVIHWCKALNWCK
jgi:hypothetical protein